jgi:hypothetical protein
VGTDGTNGNARDVKVADVITIAVTRDPWHVSVSVPTPEAALWKAALLQAADELDAQIKIARVQQMQQRTADQALANSIMRKR